MASCTEFLFGNSPFFLTSCSGILIDRFRNIFISRHFLPKEFDIWTQFVTSDYMRALELDALNNSHPIEVPVGHPSEVDEIFDAISYSKVNFADYRTTMNMLD